MRYGIKVAKVCKKFVYKVARAKFLLCLCSHVFLQRKVELLQCKLDHKEQLELLQAKNAHIGSTYVTGMHNAYTFNFLHGYRT